MSARAETQVGTAKHYGYMVLACPYCLETNWDHVVPTGSSMLDIHYGNGNCVKGASQ